jgi:hypothetical protein
MRVQRIKTRFDAGIPVHEEFQTDLKISKIKAYSKTIRLVYWAVNR